MQLTLKEEMSRRLIATARVLAVKLRESLCTTLKSLTNMYKGKQSTITEDNLYTLQLELKMTENLQTNITITQLLKI